MPIGYARVSSNDQDTAAQVTALKAAKCERTYREQALGGRWDRPELHISDLAFASVYMPPISLVVHSIFHTLRITACEARSRNNQKLALPPDYESRQQKPTLLCGPRPLKKFFRR